MKSTTDRRTLASVAPRRGNALSRGHALSRGYLCAARSSACGAERGAEPLSFPGARQPPHGGCQSRRQVPPLPLRAAPRRAGAAGSSPRNRPQLAGTAPRSDETRALRAHPARPQFLPKNVPSRASGRHRSSRSSTAAWRADRSRDARRRGRRPPRGGLGLWRTCDGATPVVRPTRFEKMSICARESDPWCGRPA